MALDKQSNQITLFTNRLLKRYKLLKKWARHNKVTCYRLYDKDIPEIPLACDLYTFLPKEVSTPASATLFIDNLNTAISNNYKEAENLLKQEKDRTYLHLYLYERPYYKEENEEKEWLCAMAKAASNVLDIKEENIIIKTRKKQKGNQEGRTTQYEKNNSLNKTEGIVYEQGAIFKINLSDYIDTGLFLDHRVLRNIVRFNCKDKRVLNLFSYTGSFSVYAAQGEAKTVESVDMSNTYLEWAKINMSLNGFTDNNRYIYTRSDVLHFLKEKITTKYDVIILDPPTFSNSKNTDTALDINKDWPNLVSSCMNMLSSSGILYFSTNSKKLKFDASLLEPLAASFDIKDISARTIPEDYRNSKIHRVWQIVSKR